MKVLSATLGAFLLCLFAANANAQNLSGANTVSSCGGITYDANRNMPMTQDQTGKLCTGATVTPGGTQDVNLKQSNGGTIAVGHGTAATALRVELPSDGTGTIALPSGAASSANQPSNSAQGATTSGQTGTLAMTATTTAPPTYVTAQTNPAASDTHGAIRTVCQDTAGTVCDFTSATLTIQTSQYPSGATPIGGNGTGTTGAVVGTLAGTSGKTTYICGFNVSATGGVATLGPIVVAGLKTASQTYQLFSTATGANLLINYGSVCIPASATNTAITVTTTADGTATAVDVNSWGYQL